MAGVLGYIISQPVSRPLNRSEQFRHACFRVRDTLLCFLQLRTVDPITGRPNLDEVSADRAYLSNENLTAIEDAGASPFVPFKVNSQGEGSAAWRKMLGCFMYRQDEFQAHYHLRSNAESVFSAIKRKFGGAVRSKKYAAQTNEILCKILCYNLSILAQAMRALGIAPSFSGKAAA
jgi:hypothetical protein